MEQKLIYKKMNEVMKDIGSIEKDQKNQAQGFKFRSIDQFVNALYPALCKHGVFISPSVVSENHELKEVERSSGKKGVDKHVHLMVKYTFWAEDGSSVDVGPIAAEGLDSGDKATNKALSAALKYCLIQTFSVPTEDMVDGDSDSPSIETKPVEVKKEVVAPTQPKPVEKAPEKKPEPVQQKAPVVATKVETKPVEQPKQPIKEPVKDEKKLPTFKKPSANKVAF